MCSGFARQTPLIDFFDFFYEPPEPPVYSNGSPTWWYDDDYEEEEEGEERECISIVFNCGHEEVCWCYAGECVDHMQCSICEYEEWPPDEDQDWPPDEGVSDLTIRLLPTGVPSASDCCSVCLEGFCEDEDVGSLPCLHVFHRGCITPWLEKRSSCPVCRAAVTDDGDVVI